MKHEQPSIFRRFSTAGIVLAIIAACANPGEVEITDGSVDVPKKDVYGQGDTNKADKGAMCMPCNIDLDCQNTCGVPENGMTWCCDTSTSSCFPSPQCSGNPDGGQD